MPITVCLEMDLQQLFDAVSTHLTPCRVKDMKTALKVLAKALGAPSPDTCPRSAYDQPIEAIYARVDTELTGRGKHTVRNTKNNLSLLFRTAAEHHLLPAQTVELKQPGRPSPKYKWEERTSRKGSHRSNHKHYYLPDKKWPPVLTQEFEDFVHWATAPIIENRLAEWKKGAVTIKNYRQSCNAYFGFLYHKEKVPLDDLRLALLFDTDKIRRFVYWHVNTLHGEVTRTIHLFLSRVSTILRQYKPNPVTLEMITKLRGELVKPKTVYNKKEVWVPLDDLEAIGRAIWPTRMPKGLQATGTGFARAAVMSLMIRLWCRRPYRQRNIRELVLGESLYQDGDGQWIIRFVGEEMKVPQKNGQPNQFELPFPLDLVADLEVYLSTWRPLLLQGQAIPPRHVFINMAGAPFQNERSVLLAVGSCIYSHTGKRFHPHLFRSVWATEYIRDTHDLYGAAVMLNDTLESVIKNYAYLLDSGTAVKSDEWFETKIIDQHKADPVNLPSKNGQEVALQIFSMLATDPLIGPVLNGHSDLRSHLLTALTGLLASETSGLLPPATKRAIGGPIIPPRSFFR